MSTIRPSSGRRGLAGFPRRFRVLGRDELGDVLAADDDGKVWCFAHGAGDWQSRTLAFVDEAQLREFVTFQGELAPPTDAETATQLRERRRRIEAWIRGRRGAPYAREAAKAAIAELAERIAELRELGSKRGRALADRQALGQRCEVALRDAGAGAGWMVRAHAERHDALVVMGPLAPPWTEARVGELLRPITGALQLVCWRRP